MLLKTQSLVPEILHIMLDKGTEAPFCHPHLNAQLGTYLCRQCGTALFRGSDQFNSHCGWPSFDEAIKSAVKSQLDRDGVRTEILCATCDAHLGHVFTNEHYTAKNTRHCVNGLSLDYVNDPTVLATEEAILAAGCFWGVEYYFRKLAGVLKTEVGYSGGSKDHPNYADICNGTTGHYEAVRIVYDPNKISYQEICKYFFEIHDFSQTDGSGPDRGQQYLSRIFYYDDTQKDIAANLITILSNHHRQVATRLLPVATFWPAEDYHQAYYLKNNSHPYCHRHQPLWDTLEA